MKILMLNGKYLTKIDVRRKDKEILKKKTEKRSTTKKKRITEKPTKESQEVS